MNNFEIKVVIIVRYNEDKKNVRKKNKINNITSKLNSK